MKKAIILILFFSMAAFQVCLANGKAANLYGRLNRLSSSALYQKGYDYIMAGKSDTALACYAIVVGRMRPADTATVSLAVGAMGNIAYVYSVHEFGKSFTYLNRAIKTAEQYAIHDKLPFLYLNMANLLRANETVRTPDRLSANVIGYYRKSFLASQKVRDWEVLLLAFNNVASLAIGCEQLTDIKPFLVDFSRLNLPQHTPGLALSRLHYQVALALLRGDRPRAIKTLRLMSQQQECKKDVRQELMVLSDMASIHYHNHDYSQCIELAEKAIALSQKHNERDVTVSFYDILAKCFLATGDHDNYRKSHLLYLEQKDSLYYQNKLLDVDYLKFESDLEDLNAKMQVMSLERKNQKIVATAAVAVALLTMAILVLVVVNYRRIRKQNWLIFNRYQQTMEEYDRQQQVLKRYELEIAGLKERQEDGKDEESSEGDLTTDQKYKYNHIDESVKDEIMARILKVLDNTEEICQDSFSVQRLSELVGWKYNYVAQVIGERFNKNFNTIIAEYRIREACRRLQDTEHYGQYSVEGIAQSVGYKSRSSFANVFKRITGLSPSVYAKMAEEKNLPT